MYIVHCIIKISKCIYNIKKSLANVSNEDYLVTKSELVQNCWGKFWQPTIYLGNGQGGSEYDPYWNDGLSSFSLCYALHLQHARCPSSVIYLVWIEAKSIKTNEKEFLRPATINLYIGLPCPTLMLQYREHWQTGERVFQKFNLVLGWLGWLATKMPPYCILSKV